jgi:hypothetical protein
MEGSMARLFQCLEILFSFVTVQLSLNCLVMASDFTTFGLDYIGCGLLTLLSFVLMLVSRLLLIRARSEQFRAGLLVEWPWNVSLALGVLLLCGALGETGWPASARFKLSRDSLESALVGHAEDWRENDGRWIGLYRVYAIERASPERAFIDFGGCGFLDHCWLVFDVGTDFENLRHTSKLSEHWYLRRLPF